MNIKENNLLENSEITYFLIGCMLGHGIFSLPNLLAKDAFEGAWIAALIGAVYPLYIYLIAVFISKNHPKENILALSKKYFGKIFGSILNFLLLLRFIIAINFIISGFNNLYYTYVTNFLNPPVIISVATLSVAITAYQGLKVLCKVNTIIFFLSCILLLLNLSSLFKGSILNLMPLTDVSLIGILKSSKESIFMYNGIDAIFLIYPSFKNIEQMKKPVIKSILIIIIIYVYTVAITVFYLGSDIVLKTEWSFIEVSESLTLPIVNNFRYVYELLWILISANLISNTYYCCIITAKDLLAKVNRSNIIISLYIIIILISLRISEVTKRAKIIDMLNDKMNMFLIIYISVIALFVFLKKDVNKA